MDILKGSPLGRAPRSGERVTDIEKPSPSLCDTSPEVRGFYEITNESR